MINATFVRFSDCLDESDMDVALVDKVLTALESQDLIVRGMAMVDAMIHEAPCGWATKGASGRKNGHMRDLEAPSIDRLNLASRAAFSNINYNATKWLCRDHLCDLRCPTCKSRVVPWKGD